MSTWIIFTEIVETAFLVFSIGIAVSYLALATISIASIKRHMKRNALTQFGDLISSQIAPSVSLIAPAYNEGETIVDNIKSMLSLEYNNYDVIVVNDGSKDDTLQKVTQAFNLVKVPFYINHKIETKQINGVYKSKNRAFKRLTIVDKNNGGKSDALNAGINISSSRLVTCIDVDCILEHDALQRMVKPFMEDSKVIACGGSVNIANECEVEHGRLIKVNLPKNQLARFQIIEYMRAFLLSRVAWAKLDALLLISGAFGMFDRKTILKAGGYSKDTVGEDMELVVRMRKMMTAEKRKFRVHLIPDPLCWTEVPDDNKVLGKQRNRWARGTIEVLKKYRIMFFNPKYKAAGLLSYPFLLFFEWLAPLLELFGLVYFGIQLIIGGISWMHFGLLLGMFYFFSVFLSVFSLYAEEISFHKYKGIKSLFILVGTALLEPFFHHPKITYWSLKGNIDHLKGVKNWGEMKRKGFTHSTQPSFDISH